MEQKPKETVLVMKALMKFVFTIMGLITWAVAMIMAIIWFFIWI